MTLLTADSMFRLVRRC